MRLINISNDLKTRIIQLPLLTDMLVEVFSNSHAHTFTVACQ